MRKLAFASSLSTVTPRAFNAAAMYRVSSLCSAPTSRLEPLASAAAISARLVMLFDPGTVTVASSGWVA
jgi:hypothetical protein